MQASCYKPDKVGGKPSPRGRMRWPKDLNMSVTVSSRILGLGEDMKRRFAFKLYLVAVLFTTLHAKGPEWQSGDVAAMDVIRTPVGKKMKYRYSYTVHANGHSYSFDETKKLPLTLNGRVRFAVDGDKLRVIDEHGKEHKETVLQKAMDKK